VTPPRVLGASSVAAAQAPQLTLDATRPHPAPLRKILDIFIVHELMLFHDDRRIKTQMWTSLLFPLLLIGSASRQGAATLFPFYARLRTRTGFRVLFPTSAFGG
jgi:hypothetical protein